MKLTMLAGIIASILNPIFSGDNVFLTIVSALLSILLMVVIAISIGMIESLIARLRFVTLPLYVLAAFVAVVLSLVIVTANREYF
jgi:Na+/glutamate symporter